MRKIICTFISCLLICSLSACQTKDENKGSAETSIADIGENECSDIYSEYESALSGVFSAIDDINSDVTENFSINAEYPKMPDGQNYYGSVMKIREQNPLEGEFYDSIKEFSYKLSSEVLTSESGNRNFSPTSVYFALSLAASGADGKTKNEFMSLFGSESVDYLSEQSEKLFKRMYKDYENEKFYIANSLWFNSDMNDIKIKQGFINNAAENYYSSVYTNSFSNDNVSEKMKAWISENTQGKLNPDLNINDDMLLCIINSLYYKTQWLEPFKTDNNYNDKFNLSDGSASDCEYMYNMVNNPYYEGDGYTVISLPTGNGKMLLALPDEDTDIKDIINSSDKLSHMFESSDLNLKKAEILLSLPKFKIESKFDLIPSLINLGINDAFTDAADFSGITDSLRILIDKIEQGTYIDVSENGVEAAAYTAIMMKNTAAAIGEPVELKFNRPFIYCIKDSNDIPMFIGIVENPSEVK